MLPSVGIHLSRLVPCTGILHSTAVLLASRNLNWEQHLHRVGEMGDLFRGICKQMGGGNLGEEVSTLPRGGKNCWPGEEVSPSAPGSLVKSALFTLDQRFHF